MLIPIISMENRRRILHTFAPMCHVLSLDQILLEEGVQYRNQLEALFCLTAIHTCREYQNHFKIVSFLNDKEITAFKFIV